ncbi:MAG: hypothetical protein ACYSUS_09170 [Planctomycetota bacterium]|jgi:hypothetical protein
MADHHHHHGQKCCSSGSSGQDERILDEQLDAAGQSLRRALKMSFSILKIIIAVLLVHHRRLACCVRMQRYFSGSAGRKSDPVAVW